MARKVILACETLEDEVLLALKAVAPEERAPVVWIQSGLHEHPELLRRTLQGLIASLDAGAESAETVSLDSVRPGRGAAERRRAEVRVGPVEEVMLAMGFCGSALQGLSAEHLRIVFPRVDDCVGLLLSGGCAREQTSRDPRHYYLTRGWFNHGSTLQESFRDWDERFGVERATELRRKMFAGYVGVSLIDTQAYDPKECLEQSCSVAAELELEHSVVPGSVKLLERLFNGERGGEIVVVEPGQKIELAHLFAVQEA